MSGPATEERNKRQVEAKEACEEDDNDVWDEQ